MCARARARAAVSLLLSLALYTVPLDSTCSCTCSNFALRRTQVLFPPFPFQHAVETEGLGKVALAMGYQAWGMPLVEVEHK